MKEGLKRTDQCLRFTRLSHKPHLDQNVLINLEQKYLLKGSLKQDFKLQGKHLWNVYEKKNYVDKRSRRNTFLLGQHLSFSA